MEKETHQPMALNIASDFASPTWEEWMKAVEESLKGVPYEKAMITKTYEGIDLKPIYRREDLQDLKHLNSLPGQAPFVRGNTAEGYLENGWVVAQKQYAWHPAQANKILLDELNRGLTCVNLKLDLFTKWAINPPYDGLDINGIWLSNLDDMDTLLRDIDLSAVPLFVNAGEASVLILALVNAHLIHQKQLPMNLHGFIGFDLLSQLAEHGEILIPEEDMWQSMYQSCSWAAAKAPHLRTVLLDGMVWGNHGASSMHELGYLIAIANTYIKELLDKGLSIEQIAPRFQMNLTLGSNLFMEIAKVRAARLLWAELLKAYGAPEAIQKIWIHGVTSSFNKTMYDPYVNMLRTTTEGFSGVIGGVDSLEILPFDFRVRPDAEFSRRIARNQQVILKEEAHLDRVIDPAGGCYYVETLTAQLAELAWKKMQDIEEAGGAYQAIKDAVIQAEVCKLSLERMQNVDKRKDIFVGINMYANPLEQPLESVEETCQCELKEHFDKIVAFQNSNRPGLDKSIESLEKHYKDAMVVDYVTDAFLHNATLDELSLCLNPNEGELKVPELPNCRATIGLESMRERAIDFQQDNKIVLSVFLANMGPLVQHKARADFVTGFLQVGGYYVAGNDGFQTVDEAVEAALFSNAQAVCICSTDDTYPELVPQLVAKLKAEKPDIVCILAGYPADMVEAYTAAGIDLFIHLRANLFDTFKDLAKKLKVDL
jgi:methylmalonyl-CoA mutase